MTLASRDPRQLGLDSVVDLEYLVNKKTKLKKSESF